MGTYPGVRPVTKVVWGLNSREPGLRWSLFGLVDPDNGSGDHDAGWKTRKRSLPAEAEHDDVI